MPPTSTAAQLQEEKEKIISLLLHDLRPPLQVLRFLTGHLAGSNGTAMPPEMIQAYMQELNEAVEELVQSSSAIFTWLEVQRERFIHKPEAVSVTALLQKTVQQFQQDVPNHTAQIKIENAEDTNAVVDANAVQTVLLQLLRNAAGAAKGGTVVLKGSQENGKLLLSVSDAGKGISEKVVQNIQEHLADNTEQPVLYRYGYRIIIKVVSLLGGQLRFESGAGTTVTLILPAQA